MNSCFDLNVIQLENVRMRVVVHSLKADKCNM